MTAASLTAASLTAASLTAACLAGAVATAGPAAAASSPAYQYLARINAERAGGHLRPLAMSADLVAVAARWSAHMGATDVLAHNPGVTSQVGNWVALGENVGYGPSVAALDVAFWNSPHHRANVMDRAYSQVGIATVNADGRMWMTVDFREPGYVAPPRRAVRRRPARHVARRGAARHVAHRTLAMGARGSDVAVVQRRLHVAADGDFGPHTRAAVVGFQHAHRLATDGVVGPITWRALGG